MGPIGVEPTLLITTLRSVVSDTFEEAHNEDQLLAILRRIRGRIQVVLPSFNASLESIEIEPIAERPSNMVGEEGRVPNGRYTPNSQLVVGAQVFVPIRGPMVLAGSNP